MMESDEAADIYQNDRRRASKDHVCCACKETIRRGDYYHHVSMLFDQSWSQWKRCLRCEAIHAHLVERSSKMDSASGWRTWPDEELNCGDDYRDVFREDPPPEIAALAFVSGADLQTEVKP